jgi:hypothetical protein
MLLDEKTKKEIGVLFRFRAKKTPDLFVQNIRLQEHERIDLVVGGVQRGSHR